MSQLEKIETLFTLLEQRYGAYDLKPGQDLTLIKKTWCHSVGRYSKSDIKVAALEYFKTAKYARWPEEGQFIEALKAIGAKPEVFETDHRPERVKEAEKHAVAFYHSLFARPAPDKAFPFSYVSALNHICGLHEQWAIGKSFGYLLTKAWLDGKIPDHFDQQADAYFDRMRERADTYSKAVKAKGPAFVNEAIAAGRAPSVWNSSK